MSIICRYSRLDLVLLKYAHEFYPSLDLFLHLHQGIPTKSNRIIPVSWNAIRNCTVPVKLSVPFVLSTNIRCVQ